MFGRKNRKSFTLIELLVVLAIVAILSTVVIMTLNPAELLKQARDSTRLSDLSTLNTALAAYSADVTNGFMGSSSVVYMSIPDTSPTCVNLGLSALPAGWTYNCVTTTSTKLSNGQGWIPVNFANISFGSPLSALPVDPVNTTTSGNYYTYVSGGSYQLSSKFESQKYIPQAAKSNPNDPSVYTIGNNTALAPFIGGLVGYWKFDEGSGALAIDSSGWGNNGSWNGTSSSRYVGGKVGATAATFNGSSDFVSVPDNATSGLTMTGWVTILAWINPTAPFANDCQNLNQMVIKGSGGIAFNYGLSAKSSAVCVWYGNSTYYSSTVSISGDSWQMVGVVESVNTTNYYLNGSFISQRTGGTDLIQSTSQPLRIGSGAVSGAASFFYNGSMDDVRLYNRALSDSEIQAIYNATK